MECSRLPKATHTLQRNVTEYSTSKCHVNRCILHCGTLTLAERRSGRGRLRLRALPPLPPSLPPSSLELEHRKKAGRKQSSHILTILTDKWRRDRNDHIHRLPRDMQSCRNVVHALRMMWVGGLDIVGNVISQSGDNTGETHLTLLWIMVKRQ